MTLYVERVVQRKCSRMIEVLSGTHGWVADPWDYNSLRFLQFQAGGEGLLLYGYGQSIYAKIVCGWEVTTAGLLALSYRKSPPYQRFQGFTPGTGSLGKEVAYTLLEGEIAGTESIVGLPYKFFWTLELDQSPWPEGLELPYGTPQTFYGYTAGEK